MTNDQLQAVERALEQDSVEAGKERYRSLLTRMGGANTTPGQTLMRNSIGAVIKGIEEWQADATNGTPGRGVGVARFLSQFDSDEVAFITLRHVVKAIHRADQKLVATAMAVVGDLETIDLEARLKKADPSQWRRYLRALEGRKAKMDGRRIGILKEAGRYVGLFSAKVHFGWAQSERLQVGIRLLEMVRDRTDIVYWAKSSTLGGSGQSEAHATYFILPTPQASAWLDAAHATMELTRPLYYPMVVPPRDWVDNEGGGYISQGTGFKRPLIKTAFGNFKGELNASALPLVTSAINSLQRVRYAVNPLILEIVEGTVAAGSVTGLPKLAEAIVFPPRYEFMDLTPSVDWSEDQKGQFATWKRDTARAKEAAGLLVAHALTTRTTVEIARKVAPYPAVYFPIQLDFRGRAYPIPAYLQPQGSDLAKGLLMFADAKPLGATGMRWLAVHIANCFGGSEKLDKKAFDVRVRWVREHHADIVECAARPLAPNAMWLTADSPFQFLAAAIEWRAMAIHTAETGDSSTFLSHIPVGLDGSCNGLQHFSAMLRDAVGGKATNLVPSETPSDIYTLVADKVRGMLELDLASEGEDDAKYAAFWLSKGISRKWTKRNTMTLPYGVTQQGMKDQLWAEIGRDDLGAFFKGVEGVQGQTVHYLATKNWAAIGEVVIAARQAMGWLQTVAKEMTRANSPILWMTPDGLPVFQFYRRSETVVVQMFGGKYQLTLRKHTEDIHTSRQKLAIAPNFVHSVDAAHMRAVVRNLASKGIDSMSMVHDSFAVHAGHVEQLSMIIRQEFIELHSTSLLAKFFEGVEPSLPEDHTVEPVPAFGDLDLSAVLQADYFFA